MVKDQNTFIAPHLADYPEYMEDIWLTLRPKSREMPEGYSSWDDSRKNDFNKMSFPVWSGKGEVPRLGTKVETKNLGSGYVVGYAVQAHFVGVWIKLNNPPEWFLKQNSGLNKLIALIYGAELVES